MMNCYEIMVLTNPHLEEKEQKDVIEFIKGCVENNGGEVIAIDRWGKRSTAYPIKHYLEAYYDVIYYKIKPTFLPELERRLKLKESILRYMNLKISEHQIQAYKEKVYAAAESKTSSKDSEENKEIEENATAAIPANPTQEVSNE